MIDCDKGDEIEESLGVFRCWNLEDEADQIMKRWIAQYKPELAVNGSDELTNCRELAKWYKLWQTLYPLLQSLVPSPCKYTYTTLLSIVPLTDFSS